MNVRSFKVERLGVKHSQYFQGAGISFTRWVDVFVGIGDSEREAVEDALDQLAMSEWKLAKEDEPNLEDYSTEQIEHEDEESDLHYYIALYVSSEEIV